MSLLGKIIFLPAPIKDIPFYLNFKLMKYLLFLLQVSLLLTAGSLNSSAQNFPKFGKIDLKTLKSNTCPIDSSAHAYYLFDYGVADLSLGSTTVYSNQSAGFQMVFKRYLRVKIIDTQGFRYATIQIPLFRGRGREDITKLKAYTYNLENGEIQKTKLEPADMLTEKTSEHLYTVKFAMPEVKAGSVLDIEYNVTSSNFYNFHTWYFQRDIPTLHSEFTAMIPEFYSYNQIAAGYFPVKFKRHIVKRSLSVISRRRQNGMVGSPESYSRTVDFTKNVFEYIADSIPAFPEEKFLRTAENYISKVDFELQFIKFPMSPEKKFTTSWEDIDNDFIEHPYFGKELNSAGYIRDIADNLKTNEISEINLLQNAYNHIKQHFSWNEFQSPYASNTLAKKYRDAVGNSADINLNLVRLLKQLGFECYPVLLSTQKHGIIHPAHPSLGSFNYVIAVVFMKNHIYLLDATDHDAEINLLPTRCINDRGRIIGDRSEKWINLMNYQPFVLQSTFLSKMDSTSSITGNARLKLNGYGAYECRKEIRKSNSTLEYLQSVQDKNMASTKIENIRIDSLDKRAKSLNISYHFVNSDLSNHPADMIYFSPVLNPYFQKNPLKLEKREYPVEFNHPYQIQQIQTFSVPANYHITQTPKPISITLPDQSAQFIYQVNIFGHNVNVSTTVKINKSIFLPEEYKQLRQFFQLMIDKQNELIVLKKDNS